MASQLAIYVLLSSIGPAIALSGTNTGGRAHSLKNAGLMAVLAAVTGVVPGAIMFFEACVHCYDVLGPDMQIPFLLLDTVLWAGYALVLAQLKSPK